MHLLSSTEDPRYKSERCFESATTEWTGGADAVRADNLFCFRGARKMVVQLKTGSKWTTKNKARQTGQKSQHGLRRYLTEQKWPKDVHQKWTQTNERSKSQLAHPIQSTLHPRSPLPSLSLSLILNRAKQNQIFSGQGACSVPPSPKCQPKHQTPSQRYSQCATLLYFFSIFPLLFFVFFLCLQVLPSAASVLASGYSAVRNFADPSSQKSLLNRRCLSPQPPPPPP